MLLTFVKTIMNALTLNANALASDASTGVTTSIYSLAADSRFVRLLDKRPMDQFVKKHGIIGDCGRSDAPSSSDGVAP